MRSVVAFALLFMTVCAWAAKPTPAELKQRAETSSGGDRAKYAVGYARYCAEAAAQAYTEGAYEQARLQLGEAARYGQMAATAAATSNRRVKQTEISIRELLTRLSDLKRAVEVEEQPSVQESIDIVEKGRDQLIEKLFGKQHPAVESK